MYMMKYYLTYKKKEILPFATILIHLEDNILSEISQTWKNKYSRPYLYQESKIVKFIKPENTRGWGKGNQKVLVKGYIVCYAR